MEEPAALAEALPVLEAEGPVLEAERQAPAFLQGSRN
jgi:hypothetical protein